MLKFRQLMIPAEAIDRGPSPRSDYRVNRRPLCKRGRAPGVGTKPDRNASAGDSLFAWVQAIGQKQKAKSKKQKVKANPP
ncbi:hypothetical protein, partial [Lysobacter capsici]|uniref:hypothetical protein n=1 Tax=Lysobacter capsici TaxID=435897 RepID=UPI00398CC500